MRFERKAIAKCRGSLHCAAHDEAVNRIGRDDAIWRIDDAFFLDGDWREVLGFVEGPVFAKRKTPR